MMGQQTPFTVLNVLGGGFMGGRYVPDALAMGRKIIDCYKDCDFMIGGVINVYGRKVVLTDCDAFTKEYYRVIYGLTDFTPKEKPKIAVVESNNLPLHARTLPVFNGWGSHEDSEGNCKTVEPKPPRFNMKKFIKLDRHLLRFGAKMLSDVFENTERIFIITFYLSDDSVSVYELGVRNSGFLVRGLCYNFKDPLKKKLHTFSKGWRF